MELMCIQNGNERLSSFTTLITTFFENGCNGQLDISEVYGFTNVPSRSRIHVQIMKDRYDAEQLIAISLFFEDLCAEEGVMELLDIPYNCLGYFHTFMQTVKSGKFSKEEFAKRGIKDLIALCLLAAYYGVPTLLSELSNAATSVMRKPSKDEQSISLNDLFRDDFQLPSGEGSPCKKNGSERLGYCVGLINTFFQNHCEGNLDLSTVCHPAHLRPGRTVHVQISGNPYNARVLVAHAHFFKDLYVKEGVMELLAIPFDIEVDKVKCFDIFMPILASEDFRKGEFINRDIKQQIALCLLAAYYGAATLLSDFSDSLTSVIRNISRDNLKFSRLVLTTELPNVVNGFRGLQSGEDSACRKNGKKRLDSMLALITTFLGPPWENLDLSGVWEHTSAHSRIHFDIEGKQYDAEWLITHARFFEDFCAEQSSTKLVKIPYNCLKYFDTFIQILNSAKLQIGNQNLECLIALCDMAAFYGASRLLSSLCSQLMRAILGNQLTAPLIIQTSLRDVPEVDGDGDCVTSARGRLRNWRSIMNQFEGFWSQSLDCSAVCGVKDRSYDYVFNVIATNSGYGYHPYNDNGPNKIINFLKFIDSTTFQVGTACNFHVPFNGFCSLKRGQRVFVRECYKEIAYVVMAGIQNPDSVTKRCDLNGTPGMGKSVFAIYLLSILASAAPSGSSLVYCHKDWGTFVAYRNRCMWDCRGYYPGVTHITEKLQPGSVVVIDGVINEQDFPVLSIPGSDGPVPRIVIGSPKVHSTQQVLNAGKAKKLVMRYLPLWEPSEFYLMMEQCYGLKRNATFEGLGISDDYFLRLGIRPTFPRIKLFGCHPSSVCYNPVWAVERLCVGFRTGLRDIFLTAGNPQNADLNRICHGLMYLKTTDDKFEEVSPVIASLFIQDMVLDIVSNMTIEDLRAAARTAYVENQGKGTYFALSFESFGHRAIPGLMHQSYFFEELNVGASSAPKDHFPMDSQLDFQWNNTERFTDGIAGLKALRLRDGVYYRPQAANFPCLDSLGRTKWTVVNGTGKPFEEFEGMIAFQFTIDKKHAVATETHPLDEIAQTNNISGEFLV
jgi:hypothetical protein